MLENKFISQIIKCKSHPSQYVLYICCSSKCQVNILFCQKCYQNHSNHSVTIYKVQEMVNKVRANALNVSKGMKLSKENYQYSFKLFNTALTKLLKDQENSIIQKIMKLVQSQKKELYQTKKILYKNKQKLLKDLALINYFSQLKLKGLLQIKIKTSNNKGIDKFKQKMVKFKEIKKDNKNLKQQLSKLQIQNEKLQKMIVNSLVEKIQDVLSFELSRRSQLKKTQKTNHTQNSQNSRRERRINSEKKIK